MSRIIIFGGLPQVCLSFSFCVYFCHFPLVIHSRCLSVVLTVLEQQYSSCTAFSSELHATLLSGKAHNMKAPRKIARVGKLKMSPDFQDPAFMGQAACQLDKGLQQCSICASSPGRGDLLHEGATFEYLWPCCSHINSLAHQPGPHWNGAFAVDAPGKVTMLPAIWCGF